jgi:hypothetical protein
MRDDEDVYKYLMVYIMLAMIVVTGVSLLAAKGWGLLH